jgi:hypothetical protein
LAELIDLGRHSQKSSSIVLSYIEPGHAGAKAMRKLEPFRLDVNRNSNRGFPRACKSDSGSSEGFGGELDGTGILE